MSTNQNSVCLHDVAPRWPVSGLLIQSQTSGCMAPAFLSRDLYPHEQNTFSCVIQSNDLLI